MIKTLKHLILAGLIGSAAASHFAHAADLDMTEGEIRKIDKASKTLTIKHGEIKNLDMPGMTMVFRVKDPAMIDGVKVGDRIRFVVTHSAAGVVVTEMVPAAK